MVAKLRYLSTEPTNVNWYENIGTIVFGMVDSCWVKDKPFLVLCLEHEQQH